jgi:hypothetical protein
MKKASQKRMLKGTFRFREFFPEDLEPVFPVPGDFPPFLAVTLP